MSPKIVDVDATISGYEESRDRIKARRLGRPADYLLNLVDDLDALALVVKTLDDLNIRLLNGYLSQAIVEDPELLDRLNEESRLFYYGRRLLPDLIDLSGKVTAGTVMELLPAYPGLSKTLNSLGSDINLYRENLGAGGGTAPGDRDPWNLGTVIQKAANDSLYPEISLGEMVQTILNGQALELSETIQATTGRAKNQAEAAALLGTDLDASNDDAYAAAGTNRERLFFNLSDSFSPEEIRNLAFILGLDHEELSPQKSALIRELILACERRGLVAELVRLMQGDRPNLEW